jgi:hypothetical protein
MIDSPHRVGWRKNPPGTYPKARHVLGSRPSRMGALPLLAKPNHFPFRGRRIDQLNANSCVAFDMARRMQLFFAANGQGGVILPSALDMYFKGRAEDYAGTDPDLRPGLRDDGTIPLNMLKAVSAQGFVLEQDYPYSDHPDRIAAEPPASLYVKSYAQHGLRWGHIDELGAARVSRVADALRHRCPVGFGMTVDEAFQENSGQRVTSIDGNRIVGGHMMTVLAVLDAQLIAEFRDSIHLPSDAQPGDILTDQWWGSDWGLPGSGLGVIAGSLFGSPWVDDVSMLEAVPPVLNRSEP